MIQKSLSTNLKKIPALESLVFGQVFTDHMLTIEYKQAWNPPQISPYKPLSISPAASSLHYAIHCFEGMKAYKDKQNKIRLFRPELNMARFKLSNQRLYLPDFDESHLLECIKELLRVDQKWVPGTRGYSLYIRPTSISINESLGVGPTPHSLIFVIMSPVGPYYKTGFNAVTLAATSDFVRAWPGGTGQFKIGANYAGGILPQVAVGKAGCQQNLWVFGPDEHVTEVGTMNLFILWKLADGSIELVTPPLDGTILPGVTRDSILSLARTWNEFKVSERKVAMAEIVEAVENQRMLEMFGSGTAAIVSPIKAIRYKGKDFMIPLNPKDKNSQAGPFTQRVADFIMAIQYGEIEHEWSIIV